MKGATIFTAFRLNGFAARLNPRLALWPVMIVVAACAVTVAAQSRGTGSISGKVVSDDGQPIAHARINLFTVGSASRLGGQMSITTDEEGKFLATGLEPAPYRLTATVPGYAQTPDRTIAGPGEFLPGPYYRPGDSVTITMTRGGAITGKVINAAGDPVIGIPVMAIRIRDEAGNPANEYSTFNSYRQTDDRGVYRLWGLAPGAYVVIAGSNLTGFSPRPTPFNHKVPAWYPSSTRDTAVEVSVTSGGEASGIDIRYRAERGFAISGRVSGAPTGASNTATSIVLKQATTGMMVASTFVSPMNDQNGYAFYGIPDGEYEAVASRTGFRGEENMMSQPRRVSVRGRDVAGIDLVLAPSASIAGQVRLERMPGEERKQKCESKRESFLAEVVVSARMDEPGERNLPALTPFDSPPIGVPDEKGSFALRNLKAGRYRLEPQLPDESWYVKSMMTVATAGAAARPAAPPSGGVARQGLSLKSGEQVNGLMITLAEGAAALKGRVVAAEGTRLPARLLVHLVPAEKEAADNVLRYAEAKAAGDGTFSFSHLAPGRYWLITKSAGDESAGMTTRPVTWNDAERARLRQEAEAANVVVELQPCQRVADFVVRYTVKQ